MSNIGLVIERRENRIPQFKGIQAHGVPSALEPGFTTQAVTHQNYLHSGFFATPGQVFPVLTICINVGTNPVVPNDHYNPFNVGTLPAGCVVTAVSMNANGSIVTDPESPGQNYEIFTSTTPAVPGVSNAPHTPITSLLFAGTPGTPIVQNGTAGTPNHTITTDNFIILQVETDAIGLIGPSAGEVCVNISYFCP